MRIGPALLSLVVVGTGPGCAAISTATRTGMKPILANGVEGLIREPDMVLAEGAIIAHMKLLEGVVATYPGDRELLELAALARANYAFAFLQDELESLQLGASPDASRTEHLAQRIRASYREGRLYAERALALSS